MNRFAEIFVSGCRGFLPAALVLGTVGVAPAQDGTQPPTVVPPPKLISWFADSSRLPAFDLIAKVEWSPEGSPNKAAWLVGSFRMMRKTDYDFPYGPPKFYVSGKDVTRTRGDLPKQWREIYYQRSDVYVTLPSDTSTNPITPAIIAFRIPLSNAEGIRSVAVVVLGTAAEADSRESKPLLRHEFSFAICEANGKPSSGLDTNAIVPIIMVPQGRFAIGSGDDPIWTYDFFSSWQRHFGLYSEPYVLQLDYSSVAGLKPLEIDWLNQDWETIWGFSSLGKSSSPIFFFNLAYDQGEPLKRTGYLVNAAKSFAMVYSPDITDMEAHKYFQISGIVLPRDWRFPW